MWGITSTGDRLTASTEGPWCQTNIVEFGIPMKFHLHKRNMTQKRRFISAER
jgi:hypothetical protein